MRRMMIEIVGASVFAWEEALEYERGIGDDNNNQGNINCP